MASVDGAFYRSKEWRQLLKIIKAERRTSDGFIICEHCGKPILKSYDIIGHHSIPLTPENVGDVTISLNPELIQLVHAACHNIIHDKFGNMEQHVFLVYGSPLSGKTTWVNSVKREGDLIVDMDNIWQCVSGCDRYIKPKGLKQNAFAIRDLLLDMVAVRRGWWHNAYVIGGYPLSNERERLIKRLGARPVFIDTNKEECLLRLEQDDRKNSEWEKYINDWWEFYTPPTEPEF